jgi:predicted Rossmann fold flavoprotein
VNESLGRETEFRDVVVLGAGGAGLFCAIEAGKRGRSVLVLDHAQKLGGKILISGGGRCNFTNTGAGPANYVSQNPHFAKSALSRYRPDDFLELVRKHAVPFHEKKLGQLFCDDSARRIVSLLEEEAREAGVEIRLNTKIETIRRGETGDSGARFRVETSAGALDCHSLVVATGGLSIPKIGATGFGYEIARQFGLALVDTHPALDGLTFAPRETEQFRGLAGVSVDCRISCNGISFRENILFTHAGLSGPAALQISLHWKKGDAVEIDLLPELDPLEWFLRKKKEGNRSIVRNLLSELLPSRLSDLLCELYFPSASPLPQVSEKALAEFCHLLRHWRLQPSGTVGYGKAEVTRGGVDTDELSSKTLEAKKVPGLFFIGEVVDVTGWLGGYNFQWAWASGWAAGQVV